MSYPLLIIDGLKNPAEFRAELRRPGFHYIECRTLVVSAAERQDDAIFTALRESHEAWLATLPPA